jgi:predicted nucleic acid-binding protein
VSPRPAGALERRRRGARRGRVLREFERVVPELPIAREVWKDAYDLARQCRAAGVTVPASDLLIESGARRHAVALEQADADFDRIAEAAPRDNG